MSTAGTHFPEEAKKGEKKSRRGGARRSGGQRGATGREEQGEDPLRQPDHASSEPRLRRREAAGRCCWAAPGMTWVMT